MGRNSIQRVRNVRTGELLGQRIRSAHRWFSRLRGLLGTRRLEPGSGLWLKPCGSIHTIGMRYSIDVIFLGRDNRVRRVAAHVPPFRICGTWRGGHSALELPPGTIARAGVREGDVLEFESVSMGQGAS